MKSTVGRPRSLTDAQIAKILIWHDAVLALKAERRKLPTVRELARELGVSPGTINSVIRRRGQYKQPSPEHREAELRAFRERLSRARRR